YQGREAIRVFLLAKFGEQNRWQVVPTHANAQPAFVLYRADGAKSLYQAAGIQVVTIDGSRLKRQIAEVTIFLRPSLVTSFGFPLQLPQES
ncbi:MAG TPA: RNA polymerase subunit sigma-24, partial [Ktedonobacteraceae bacterium]|nr:RNA polymerase subunit sigma-24 [Ktedonobacteraceae bacterium]